MRYDGIKYDETFYGFHKGRLSGLDAQSRLEKQRNEERWYGTSSRLFDTPPIAGVLFDRISGANTKASADASLEEVLSGCVLQDLNLALRRAGISTKSGQRKANLVALLAEELPKAVEGLRSAAQQFESEAVTLLQRTLKGETVHYKRLNGFFSIPSAFPFVFVTQAGRECIAFTPRELREAFSTVDLDPYKDGKRALETTNQALHAVTSLCGVMPLDSVFALLSRDEENALTREQFDTAVRLLAAHRNWPTYSLLESDGVTYVTRCQRCWTSPSKTEFFWERHTAYDNWGYRYSNTAAPAREDELLAQQHAVPITRFEAGFSVFSAIDEFVYGLPCVQRLTSYFDAHVPSDWDDYSFADKMVDLLIHLVLIEGVHLKAILAWLTRTGWYLSEGSASAPVLTKLICDLFSELPRWEYGGWSEREYLDLMNLPYIISESQCFDDGSLELAS